MNIDAETSSSFDDADETSPSLRDVAAYLRGVADATAALSQRAAADFCAQDIEPVAAPMKHAVIRGAEPVSSSRETLMEMSPMSSRRTVPYDGLENASDTMRVRETLGYPSLEAAAEMGRLDFDIDDAWTADERPSEVRLKVGLLSPEWYELIDARVG